VQQGAPAGRVEGWRTPIAERDERVVADHEMVEQLDVQETARSERLGREVEVVRAGCRVAGWMVVDEDQAAGVQSHGVPEQLPDPHEGRAHVALVDGDDAEHDVLRIQQHSPQLLALEPTHLEDQSVCHVMRRTDRPAPRRPVGEQAPTELEARDELGGARRADAG
jgi:hypothetical protein